MTTEIEKTAHYFWVTNLPLDYMHLDHKLAPFLAESISGEPYPWLRESRKILQLSAAEIAARSKLCRTHISRIERQELEGSVSIETMRDYAEAMGCEFVYAIRPKGGLTFRQRLWTELKPLAWKSVNTIPLLPDQEKARKLTQRALYIWRSPKQRRFIGWTDRVPRS